MCVSPGAQPFQTTGSPLYTLASERTGHVKEAKPDLSLSKTDPPQQLHMSISGLQQEFKALCCLVFKYILVCFRISKHCFSLNNFPVHFFSETSAPQWKSNSTFTLERLRWEVWAAVKMDRFHHFLHSNYHTLSASALPLLIACFTTSHTHRTMRDAAGKWLTLQPSPAASESS